MNNTAFAVLILLGVHVVVSTLWIIELVTTMRATVDKLKNIERRIENLTKKEK